jgi:RND superfamily putative drug exporter
MVFAAPHVGPAIFVSGSTVIAGMLCLLVASLNSTKGLGPVAVVRIAVGLRVMLTLLPALNLDVGRHLWWPSSPAHKKDPDVVSRQGRAAHHGAT